MMATSLSAVIYLKIRKNNPVYGETIISCAVYMTVRTDSLLLFVLFLWNYREGFLSCPEFEAAVRSDIQMYSRALYVVAGVVIRIQNKEAKSHKSGQTT
jgi:hypothetical protein